MKPVVVPQQVVSLMFILVLLLALFAPASVSAQTTAPTATVVSAGLNVRSGPGTTFARVSSVTRNTVLPVIGQVQNCGWLKVKLPDGVEGWVSGGARYTRLNVACSAVPVVANVAGAAVQQPAATPTRQGAAAAPSATPAQPAPGNPPTATATPKPPSPTATPTPVPPSDDPYPPDQACYLVQNFVGPELTVTFTNQDTGQSMDFRVPAGGQEVKCISPGRYTATADAPPPWNSINFEFRANAGDRELMPFTAQN